VLSVVNADGSTESGSLIDEIVREGARRMLAAALEADVSQYTAELAAETDEHEQCSGLVDQSREGRREGRTFPNDPVMVTE
jgi:hypothetical protein